MLTKMKKVYYCEFCSKHSLRPLTSHELHCTLNPNRECGMCSRILSLTPIIKKWKKTVEEIRPEIEKRFDHYGNVPKELMDKIHYSKIQEDLGLDCPACTLAIIRMSGLAHLIPHGTEFDFKEQVKKWWEEKNEEDVMPGFEGE